MASFAACLVAPSAWMLAAPWASVSLLMIRLAMPRFSIAVKRTFCIPTVEGSRLNFRRIWTSSLAMTLSCLRSSIRKRMMPLNQPASTSTASLSPLMAWRRLVMLKQMFRVWRPQSIWMCATLRYRVQSLVRLPGMYLMLTQTMLKCRWATKRHETVRHGRRTAYKSCHLSHG